MFENNQITKLSLRHSAFRDAIPYQFNMPEGPRIWDTTGPRSYGLMELDDDFLMLKGYHSDLAWDVNRVIESYHQMNQFQSSSHNAEGTVDGARVVPIISITPDFTIQLKDAPHSKKQTHYSRRNILFINDADGEHGRRFSVWDQHPDQSGKLTLRRPACPIPLNHAFPWR